MVKSILALLLVAVIYTVHCEVKEEFGVLVVTTANWNEVVTPDANVLVEFYAPWCGHCKKLAPEYAAAATKLKFAGSDVKLAKVDAEVETQLAAQYNVKGFPTLKFFKKGVDSEYSGGRTADEIVQWLEKKTGPPATPLASSDDVKKFTDSNEVAVIGFFKDQESDYAKAFLTAAEGLSEIAEYGIASPDASGEYAVKDDAIIVLKKFDDPRADYTGKADVADIKQFIQTESSELVTEYNKEAVPKIFGGDIKSHHLLLISKTDERFEGVMAEFKKTAKLFRGRVMFILIDMDTDLSRRVLEFMVAKPEDTPMVRITHLYDNDEMDKYKPDTKDLDAETFTKFTQDFVDKKIKTYMGSEDLPEDWDKNPVKVIVAKNFKEVVLDTKKDVLIEFYAPWCGHCKRLAPIWEEFGEKFKNRDDIVIAKMNSVANEIEGMKISSFPTIILYKKGTNEQVEYSGEKTLEKLVQFMESGGHVPDQPQEDLPDDEKDDNEQKRDENDKREVDAPVDDGTAPPEEQDDDDGKRDEL